MSSGDEHVTATSRREFLRAGAAAGGLAALGGIAAGSGRTEHRRPAPSARAGAARAKNVIFMVADGMSHGTLTLADVYCRRLLERPSAWGWLIGEPRARRALAMTHSNDSLVTDSAAGASAWGIGRKVNNSAVNMLPNGAMPQPLMVRARAAGIATGLVTTTRITHATPAGFIANSPRDDESAIAEQLLARRVDVALGGGSSRFKPDMLNSAEGVRVVRTKAELHEAASASGDGGTAGGMLLGLFAAEHMSMELDRVAARERNAEPTIVEMTSAAIGVLSERNAGFMMMVEGGRVDHAAHANDAGSLLAEQLAFDAAVRVVLDFALSREDTLVVLTTDHGNANPGLTFYGKKSFKGFETLKAARRSFEWFASQLAELKKEKSLDPDAVAGLAEQTLGFALSHDETATLMKFLGKQAVNPFDEANELGPVLGELAANHTGVAFMSPNHTSDHVEVTAFGPGSDRLGGLIDNTDLHTLVVEAIGLPAAK